MKSPHFLYWQYLALVSSLIIYMLHTAYEGINFPAEGLTELSGLIFCDLRSESHGEMQSLYELALNPLKGRFSPHEIGIFAIFKCVTSFSYLFCSSPDIQPDISNWQKSALSPLRTYAVSLYIYTQAVWNKGKCYFSKYKKKNKLKAKGLWKDGISHTMFDRKDVKSKCEAAFIHLYNNIKKTLFVYFHPCKY